MYIFLPPIIVILAKASMVLRWNRFAFEMFSNVLWSGPPQVNAFAFQAGAKKRSGLTLIGFRALTVTKSPKRGRGAFKAG